jgi:hypothetical protein
MEIVESTLWIFLGFVPTLALLEIYDRLRKGRKKDIPAVTAKVPALITG